MQSITAVPCWSEHVGGLTVAQTGNAAKIEGQVMPLNITEPASAAQIAEVRRWLWEQFNVRRDRSLIAPRLAAGLWASDPTAAARSLGRCLAVLVQAKQCDVRDATAWAKMASLEGKRTPKSTVALQAGTGERGLHNRLHRVDARIAELINTEGLPVPGLRANHTEVVVQGLVESTQSRLHGRIDEGDGIYLAAAELADAPPSHRACAWGRDRTRRARARHRARAGLPLRAGRLPMPLDLGLPPQSNKLVLSPYELSDEPGRAIDELRRAWQDRASDVVPILLAHAALVADDERIAGIDTKLRLLETGSNILRDSESLLALSWSTVWLRTAEQHLGSRDIQVIKARRTRAHVLQLHGLLKVAGLELDAGRRAIGAVRCDVEHREAELVDLLLRRTSVDIAGGTPTVHESRQKLFRAFEHDPNPGLLPGLLRNQLQLASLHEAANRRRRTFGGLRSRGYEAALDELMTVLEQSEPTARIAMWDSIVASASRVGDTETVRQAATAASLLSQTGAVNLLHRLKLHLAVAARLPGLWELRDVQIEVPQDPLRRPELIPRHVEHLV